MGSIRLGLFVLHLQLAGSGPDRPRSCRDSVLLRAFVENSFCGEQQATHFAEILSYRTVLEVLISSVTNTA